LPKKPVFLVFLTTTPSSMQNTAYKDVGTAIIVGANC